MSRLKNVTHSCILRLIFALYIDKYRIIFTHDVLTTVYLAKKPGPIQIKILFQDDNEYVY